MKNSHFVYFWIVKNDEVIIWIRAISDEYYRQLIYIPYSHYKIDFDYSVDNETWRFYWSHYFRWITLEFTNRIWQLSTMTNSHLSYFEYKSNLVVKYSKEILKIASFGCIINKCMQLPIVYFIRRKRFYYTNKNYVWWLWTS